MLKLRLYHGLLAVSFLAVLSGCKKDNETSSFVLTGAESLHFEYGQQKEAGFTARNVSDISVDEFPEGWDCRISGSAAAITAPQEGVGETQGDVVISARNLSGSAVTLTIAVEIKPAQTISGHANSYIAAQPGTRYRFDGRYRGNEASATLEPDDAVLVWVTASGAVSHVSYEDGYIYFATAEEDFNCNALIAALDGEGNILWSWHIWCTDYDPETNFDELEDEKVMNRNLGAFANSNASSDDAFLSYGLYYQWGRKDPFVGVRSWNSTVQALMYGPAGGYVNLAFTESDSSTGTMAYATANPTHFLLGTEDTAYDWLFAGRDNTLWGNANAAGGVATSRGSKTVNDPCPEGWMVAPPSIWKSFTKTGAASATEAEFNVSGVFAYGWVFDTPGGDVYFPAAGRRSFYKSDNFTNVTRPELAEKGPVGFYWSNSNSSATGSVSLAFRHDYINPTSQPLAGTDLEQAEVARAGGFPLRCVKEQP